MLKKVEETNNSNRTRIVYTVDEYNRRQGVSKIYDLSGRLLKKSIYKDGDVISYEAYYLDGQLSLKYTTSSEKDTLYETYIRYYENGKLWEKRTDKNGKTDGLIEEYYEDGKLKIKCTYQDGKRKGPFEKYFRNGNLEEKGTYLDEYHFDGPYERYHENGQLREKSTYKNGQLDGLYESYFENGQLSERCFHTEGQRNGPLERYRRDGSLVEKIVYRDWKQLSGQEAEDFLKEWEKMQKEIVEKAKVKTREHDPEWQDLKDRLKHLTDDKYFKAIPKACTPERQVELEEILMTRRAKAVLLKAATKARLAGDKDRFDAIMKLAEPFAKKHDLVVHLFHDKRAENKKRTRKNSGR